ncbi:unnamed protein product [Parnassius mnemosyne]|uniref:Uncharacterized protein n=1 Tax=Parnassius mnemosyne TaxID=213953 RepID=A0AAV1KKL3_9NEOP
MDSLLGSYRREMSREKKSRITGSGRGEIYVSNWYAYEAFSFLGDRNHPGNTQDTLGEENASLDNTRNDDGHNEERNETSNSTITEEHKQKLTRPKKRSKMNESDDLTDNAISEALTLTTMFKR